MATFRLVALGEPTEFDHDLEAVTITEDAGHRDGAGELLELRGRRFVGHLVQSDEGVSRLPIDLSH